jgi:hypothetical protein
VIGGETLAERHLRSIAQSLRQLVALYGARRP